MGLIFTIATLALAQEGAPAAMSSSDETAPIGINAGVDAPPVIAEKAAAPSPKDPPLAKADADLLDALLALLSDGRGVEGARQLGLLSDPRALWVLRHTVEHRDPAVAGAAALSLAAFPEAAPDLQRWVLDEDLHDGVRGRAAASLGVQRAGVGAILQAMAQRDTSPELRASLREVVATAFPERLAEADGVISSDGTAWLMAAGAAGVGYSLAATGHFGQSNLEGLGGVAGALGGATLGYYLGRANPMEAGDAAMIATAGATGLTAGTLIGAGIFEEEGAPWVGGLLGGAMSYGAAIPAARRYRGTPTDALVAQGVGLSAAFFATSTVSFLDQNGELAGDEMAAVWGAGLLAGTAAGHAVGAHLSGEDVGAIGLAAVYGTYAGAVFPLSSRTYRASLPGALANAAGIAAWAASPHMDLPYDVSAAALTGLAYGATGGGLLGVLIDPDEDQLQQGLSLGLGTAAMAVGGYRAHLAPGGIHADDAVMVGVVTGWSAWQSVGWANVVGSPSDRGAAAATLIPVVLGSATALATPQVQVPFSQSLSAVSMGLWGAYLGSVGATLADADSDAFLASALVVSDIGLLGGTLLTRGGSDPMVVGLGNAGGVVGGATAALVAAMATSEQDPILVASLAGAGLGAWGGALAGKALRQSAVSLHFPAGTLPSIQVVPTYFHVDGGGCYGGQVSVMGW